jgi:DNA-binding LacI/PurR family transcriptional regulator
MLIIKKIGAMMQTANRTHEPIYRRIFNSYKESIISHLLVPGSRIDSIAELQKRHHVSRETAKLVLNKLAREGLIVQHPGKGSFVSDLTPRKKIWAAILPFYSAQYESFLQCLKSSALAMGRELHHFLDYNNYEEEINLVGATIAKGYEAVIVIPTLDESKTASFYGRLSPRETFVALADHTSSGSYFPYVIQSYDLGIQRAMEYLIVQGATRIAFVKNDLWSEQNLVQQLMEETFKEIHSKRNLAQEAIILPGFRDATASLCRERGINGILCCDDADAIRIIGNLKG